jgi:hypothetical protein
MVCRRVGARGSTSRSSEIAIQDVSRVAIP